jgi:hypothetical protein
MPVEKEVISINAPMTSIPKKRFSKKIEMDFNAHQFTHRDGSPTKNNFTELHLDTRPGPHP